METNERAAWDQRYSGPDLAWGAGPNRFVTEEVTALPAGRAIDLDPARGATRSGLPSAAGRSPRWTSPPPASPGPPGWPRNAR
jgi:hypothetical protein